jgi:hypothetical protein
MDIISQFSERFLKYCIVLPYAIKYVNKYSQ